MITIIMFVTDPLHNVPPVFIGLFAVLLLTFPKFGPLHVSELAKGRGRYVCLLKLEDTEGALAEMRRVVAIDPSHHQAWSSLGGLLSKKRLKREALFAFREACKLRGDSWRDP